jgi:hypothetical protein
MNMRFHGGNPKTLEDTSPKTSSVHVLNDEEDLRAALQRAAEFDQRAADMLLSRSARYRSLLTDTGRGRAAE